MDFKQQIKPFFWVDHNNHGSVCLNAGEYKNELFETRADEGFEGGGYDWESLAKIFLAEQLPELEGIIQFDSEASMFCVYSSEKEKLEKFILSFKEACETDDLINDIFSRAELD